MREIQSVFDAGAAGNLDNGAADNCCERYPVVAAEIQNPKTSKTAPALTLRLIIADIRCGIFRNFIGFSSRNLFFGRQ